MLNLNMNHAFCATIDLGWGNVFVPSLWHLERCIVPEAVSFSLNNILPFNAFTYWILITKPTCQAKQSSRSQNMASNLSYNGKQCQGTPIWVDTENFSSLAPMIYMYTYPCVLRFLCDQAPPPTQFQLSMTKMSQACWYVQLWENAIWNTCTGGAGESNRKKVKFCVISWIALTCICCIQLLAKVT